MPIIQAGKVATYYQKIGKGPALVLLHGWANTWEAWSPLIPALSEKYTLLIPDLPSFGRSETPGGLGWTTKEFAQWLSLFVEATVDKKEYVLIGHSYGGKIGVYFASHDMSPAPKQLVLIGSSGIMNTLSPSKKAVSLITKATPRVLKNLLPHAFVRWFYEKVVGETDYVHANNFQKLVLRNILAEDFTEDMKNIAIPTLIIWGDNDTSSPTERAGVFHKQISGSRLRMVEHTGHFPHHEKPTEVLTALQEFISL